MKKRLQISIKSRLKHQYQSLRLLMTLRMNIANGMKRMSSRKTCSYYCSGVLQLIFFKLWRLSCPGDLDVHYLPFGWVVKAQLRRLWIIAILNYDNKALN